MKTIVLLFCLMAICTLSLGQQVTQIEAAAIAKTEMLYTKGVNTDVSNIYSFDSNGYTLIYEVLLDNGFTVLVSGNKQCIPAIGRYATCGSGSVFDQTDIPCGLSYFLMSYKEQIMYCFEHPSPNSMYSVEWSKMVNGENIYECNRSGTVDSLLLTKWGQGWISGGNSPAAYNYYTPRGDGCEHTLAGCVAVAMGQVMNYWQWPVLTTDNWQFDWCNMPIKLDTGSTNYKLERNAVARLLERCGYKVNMNYRCDNSTSYVISAKNALDEMGYNEESDFQLYAFHSDSWENHLKDNLDSGWPVIYGAGSYIHNGVLFPSHCFVCDGYSRDGKFHFNWGWRGKLDGFFYATHLDPGDHNYSNYFSAIFDLRPDGETSSYCDISLRLDIFYSMYLASNPDSNVALYDITPRTFKELTSAPSATPASYRTIPSGTTAEYVAHKEIILQPGFTAEYGSDFTARIEPCAACEEQMIEMEMLSDEGSENIPDTTGNEKRLFMSGDTVILAQPSNMHLYPNPTDNTLTVKSTEKIENIRILDNMGRPMFRWFIESNADGLLTLNVQNLPDGVYFLQLTTSDRKSHLGRFVKK
ncbi:MAG: C10 family peptidase [Bacteroidales bacterium]|nr:C10 family peptidase [Bacteroidales bacterium]